LCSKLDSNTSLNISL